MNACKIHVFVHMPYTHTHTLRAPCLLLCLGARRWEKNKHAALASLGQAVGGHFHVSVCTQSDIGCAQPPGCISLQCSGCVESEPSVHSQCCRTSQGLLGLARACGWQFWDHAQHQDPHWILAGSSPLPPKQTTAPSGCVPSLFRKAEPCTCARGAGFLFGVLPGFFHPGENLLGETGVCTEVGFAR